MVSWLLFPHLPDGGVLLNVFYPNPNPETAFFQKKDKPQPQPHVLLTPIWIHTFLNAYSPHSASHPHLVSGHFALWCIWKCLLFSASYIMMAGAINICPFNCVCLEKYCHLGEGTFHFLSAPSPLPPFPSLPPSLRVSFWKVGLRCNLDPSDISFKIKVMHQVLTKNLGFRPQPCLRKGWRGMDTNANPK